MTPRRAFFIDTNLLLLLVVGSLSRDLIGRHRRLSDFTMRDYDLLLELIETVSEVLVTPNTLTETSNLLSYHGEPERSALFRRFRFIIQNSQEVVVTSAGASSNSHFTRLGLTDAALLEVVTEETPLLTVDDNLYRAALSNGAAASFNFTHLRKIW